MISDCSSCKTKCCKVGHGPWKKYEVYEWLNLTGSKKYNSMCENFDEETELCKIWNVGAPLQCQVFVCHNKKFSEKRLKEIDRIINQVRNSKPW